MNPSAVAVSKKDRPRDKAVKIDRDLAARGKYLAELEGVPLSEFLSNILRPVIERKWAQAARNDTEGGK